MSSEYSEAELISFLDYLANKNLLNTSTVSARKAASIKILSAVDEDEKADLRILDRDQLFHRFANKYGKDFTPESLVTYKSRYNLALNHFLEYKQNPAAFKIGNSKKTIKDSNAGKKSTSKKSPPLSQEKFTNSVPNGALEQKTYVLQIPISDGRLIEIRNLPMDLNELDAKKIAGIITAHVV